MVALLTDYFNLALERVRLVFGTTIDVLVRPTVSCSANKNNAHAVAAHSVLVNDILHCSFVYGPICYSKLSSCRHSSSFNVLVPLTASLRCSTPRARIDKKSYTMSAAAMADISARGYLADV